MDLEQFNLALLGKWWWWTLTIDDHWCGSKVIHFNYSGNNAARYVFSKPPKRKSYLSNGILSYLSAFRG